MVDHRAVRGRSAARDPCARAASRCRGQVPLADLHGLRGDHRDHDVRDVSGGEARAYGVGFLYRGRRCLGAAERLGNRRRLFVGGILFRHRRPHFAVWLRRIHVLGRLAGRLYHGAAADRGALPQYRALHALGHLVVSQRSEKDACRRRAVDDYRVDVLSDRANGRRRRARQNADRHQLRNLGRRSRHLDAALRDLRRHGCNDLGANHQGCLAGRRIDRDRRARVGSVWVFPARVLSAMSSRTRGFKRASRLCSGIRRRR